MKQNSYKAPRVGGAAKIKESFVDQRKRKPSKTLLEILKEKSGQKTGRSEKKVAWPRSSEDMEL